MSKHIVFLVHGMGNFEPGWSGGIQQQLKDLFAAYSRAAPFGQEMEYREIVYGDVFESWRELWKSEAEKAASALKAVGLDGGVAEELVKLAGSPAGDGFLKTHVLDVVMYRFLLQASEEVCQSVRAQITEHLLALPDQQSIHYTVIAHSLGTAVMYEAFFGMMTAKEPLRVAFRPDNVFMVANAVLPLWNRGGTPYQPIMAPNLGYSDGWCFHLANFRHELDPVAMLIRFQPPPNWFTPLAPKDVVYLDQTIPAEDIQDPNVHALEHYLGHPSVHIPLLRRLSYEGAINKAEEKQALAEWRKERLTNAKLKEGKDKLESMLLGKATQSWKDEFAMLLALRKLMLSSKLKDGES